MSQEVDKRSRQKHCSDCTLGMASSLARTRKLAGLHRFFKARTNPQPAHWLASLNFREKNHFSTYFAIFFGRNFYKRVFIFDGRRSTPKSHKLHEKSLEKKSKKLEKARKLCLLCTGPTRPAARIVKPDPTRARSSKTRPDPSPQKSGSKPSLLHSPSVVVFGTKKYHGTSKS